VFIRVCVSRVLRLGFLGLGVYRVWGLRFVLIRVCVSRVLRLGFLGLGVFRVWGLGFWVY
jgi:hypothetical protein